MERRSCDCVRTFLRCSGVVRGGQPGHRVLGESGGGCAPYRLQTTPLLVDRTPFACLDLDGQAGS